jgi:P-type Ca2+ transporter type 2C
MGTSRGSSRTARRSALDGAGGVRVRSLLPGRIRLWLGLLERDAGRARVAQQALEAMHGVRRVTVNPLTGAALIVFDDERPLADITVQLAAAFPPDVAQRVSAALESAARSAERWVTSPRRRLTLRPIHLRRGAEVPLEVRRPAAPPWHVLAVERVLSLLDASPEEGLSQAMVRERRARHGFNVLPKADVRSDLAILVGQLTSGPTLLLVGSSVLAVATGGVADAVVILCVVALNTTIGFITERTSERTIESLLEEERGETDVRREGRRVSVPVEDLVPGDILILEAGDEVPADGRVLLHDNLTVSESSLTGESQPVTKRADAVAQEDVALADRSSMLYRGTQVTAGHGEAVVVATGEATELGRIQWELASVDALRTPMQRELAHMGGQLVTLASTVCAGVFVVGLMRGHGLLPMLRIAVSLAVAAVPEGLPTVATTALALGVRRMRGHRVVIRNVGAIETLGAVEVMCFDKTGTITENRMVAQLATPGNRTVDVRDGGLDGEDGGRLCMASVLCSDVTQHPARGRGRARLRGDPTEVALVELAVRSGMDVDGVRAAHPRIGTRPQEADRPAMSTLHEGGSAGRFLVMKGQPEHVLQRCTHLQREGESVPLRDSERDEVLTANEALAGRALRVLGFAWGTGEAADQDREEGLTWLGLVGIADPPRADIHGVLRRFQQAGIKCVMITGDQGGTALAVARSIGMATDGRLEVLDAMKIDSMRPEVLRSLASRVDVFARVSPSQKLQIVRALQDAGHVVAMTGDGINDGPALKAADIGVALGRSGAEVARQVADMVLLDDELVRMLVATEEGRAIYEDIRHAVSFVLATNLSEIVVTTLCVAAGVAAPLSSIQLLWINLLTDVLPELALAVQPASDDIMERSPRPSGQPMFQGRDMGRLGFEGGLISTSALAAYGYGLARHGPGSRASTTAFMGLTVSQLLHAISARSDTHSVFDRETLRQNAYLPTSIAGSIGLQVLGGVIPPIRRLLGTVPLGPWDWVVSALAGVLPFLIVEGKKCIARELPDATVLRLGRGGQPTDTGEDSP